MIEYIKPRFLYPPRPEFAITPDRIPYYEEKGWAGQYKKNGTCTILICSPKKKITIMNRHGEDHKAWKITPEISETLAMLLPDCWTVLVGEILHSKGPDIKNTIYFHDVLVNKSKFLLRSSFMDRQKILDRLLPSNSIAYSHYGVTQHIWKARLITKDLTKHFDSIKNPKIDEGLVLKNPESILKLCDVPNSNSGWQVKVRYPTKIYNY